MDINQLKHLTEKKGKLSFRFLAEKVDFSWLKMPKGVTGRINKAYNAESKAVLAAKIVLDLFEMVIEDVIEGHIFKFPGKEFYFYVGRESKDYEKRKNRNEENLFEKGFKQYTYLLAYKHRSRIKKIKVITDKARFDRLADNYHKYVEDISQAIYDYNYRKLR